MREGAARLRDDVARAYQSMSDQQISRRGALKYLGLLSASVAGREFLARGLRLASESRWAQAHP